MIKELCIIGHPSHLGGADCELDHQIRLWQEMGIKVHICHTGALDQNLKNMKMKERGCIYHKPMDWKSLKGFHVISFCNGRFLQHLPTIKPLAKTTTFVNCMTWNFQKEIECQTKGLIDFHLYQTDHAMGKVRKKLENTGRTYRPIRFKPYFHKKEFSYHDNRPTDKFRFGRISRGDADKFCSQQLWVYETFTAPVMKEGIILGWDQRAEKKFKKKPPAWIKTYREGGITQKEFYKTCSTLIMCVNTFENLPRIGFESMSSGTLMVVDKGRGGFDLQVDHGKTGWLCKNDREFVYYATRVAHEIDESNDMRAAAQEKLEREWGIEASMKSWENVFNEWEKLR